MVLELDLTVVDHLLQQLQSLVLLVSLDVLVRLQQLQLQRDIVALAVEELRCEVLHLCVEQSEGAWVGELQVVNQLNRKFLVRLPDLLGAVGVGAVLAELADLALLPVLALLRLEVVVRDVQHFVLHFDWQGLLKS